MHYLKNKRIKLVFISFLFSIVSIFAPYSVASSIFACKQSVGNAQPSSVGSNRYNYFEKLLKVFGINPTSDKLNEAQLEIQILKTKGKIQKADSLRSALEQRLRSENITISDFVGAGQSKPRFGFLTNKDLVIVKGFRRFFQSPQAEVAAYVLNKFFGDFVNVPPTIMREIDGQEVSVQLYLKGAKEYEPRNTPRYFRQCLRFFDYLIDNHDRRSENLLIDSKGFFAAIDNGIGFRSKVILEEGGKKLLPYVTTETSWSTVLSAYNDSSNNFNPIKAKKFILNSLPPRKYYDLLKSTPDSEFESLFASLLSHEDISAFLKRKDFFIETVEEWLQAGNKYPNFTTN